MAKRKRLPTELNEKEFIEYLCKENDNYFKYEYKEFLETFTAALEKLLLEGKTMKITNLGVFKTVMMGASNHPHPATGEPLDVPSRELPKFTFARIFKDRFKEEYFKREALKNETNLAEP